MQIFHYILLTTYVLHALGYQQRDLSNHGFRHQQSYHQKKRTHELETPIFDSTLKGPTHIRKYKITLLYYAPHTKGCSGPPITAK